MSLVFSTVEAAGATFTICRVDLRTDHLRLFLRDDQKQAFRTFSNLERWLKARRERLTFAMNAGMYQEDLSPVGLFVAQGRETRRLNTRNARGNFYLKPNGVFAVADGQAHVVETSAYPALRRRSRRVDLATQSGPLLVLNGRVHPVFGRTSQNIHFRNGVGVPDPHTAIFAISDVPVTFFQFASLFYGPFDKSGKGKATPQNLRCPNALYFDGNVSSLYAPPLHRHDRTRDLGPLIAAVSSNRP